MVKFFSFSSKFFYAPNQLSVSRSHLFSSFFYRLVLKNKNIVISVLIFDPFPTILSTRIRNGIEPTQS
eukprot:maker-scaffold_1-snap-gene-16.26-mRNA-1 protein AED:0.45 eAED:0.45 QI:0/0.5/0/1/0/0/3/0/67